MEVSDRKVVTRSPSHAVHAVCAGGLLDSHVEAESRLEAHFIRRAALIPSRPKIIHQPFKAPITKKGYTPDFLVYFPRSGFKAVVEVKPAELISSEFTHLFDRAAEFFPERGFIFFVVTDYDLKRGEIHRRAKLLTRYAKDSITEETMRRATDALSTAPLGLPIGTLAKRASVSHHEILSLIAHGALRSGSKLQTDLSALVFLPTNTDIDDEIFFRDWFNTTAWGPDA